MSLISLKKMYVDRVRKGYKIKLMNRTKMIFQIIFFVFEFLEIKSVSSKQVLISTFYIVLRICIVF